MGLEKVDLESLGDQEEAGRQIAAQNFGRDSFGLEMAARRPGRDIVDRKTDSGQVRNFVLGCYCCCHLPEIIL